ncbi:hypothetical protein H072_477 [Dactylellina haptotyla CBS 200.50]|uniref:WW domain-containing protein n=1 Tax=Dactylellina haptotyla (strain CBS 200.50) TaxID=1284197 RepID=S8ARD8_DACHA|nr:hypothetical protein H072_477 [Dactylellina haptotyla CBS 200.50]
MIQFPNLDRQFPPPPTSQNIQPHHILPSHAPPRDTRPLPPGWHQQYDPEQNVFFYIDMNIRPWTPFWDHPMDMGYDPNVYGRRFKVDQVFAARRAGYRISGAYNWTRDTKPAKRKTPNPYLMRAGRRVPMSRYYANTGEDDDDEDEGYEDGEYDGNDEHGWGYERGESSAAGARREVEQRQRQQRRGSGRGRVEMPEQRVFTDAELDAMQGWLTPRVLRSRAPSPAPAPPPPYSSPAMSTTRLVEDDTNLVQGNIAERSPDGDSQQLERENGLAVDVDGELDQGSTASPSLPYGSLSSDEEPHLSSEDSTAKYLGNGLLKGGSPNSTPPTTMRDRLRRFLNLHVPTPMEKELKRRLKEAKRELREEEIARKREEKYQQGIEQTKKYNTMMNEMNEREKEIRSGNIKSRFGFNESLFKKQLGEGTLVDNNTAQSQAAPTQSAPTATDAAANLATGTDVPQPAPPPRRSFFGFRRKERGPRPPRPRKKKKVYLKTPPYLGSFEDFGSAGFFNAAPGVGVKPYGMPRSAYMAEMESIMGKEFMEVQRRRYERENAWYTSTGPRLGLTRNPWRESFAAMRKPNYVRNDPSGQNDPYWHPELYREEDEEDFYDDGYYDEDDEDDRMVGPRGDYGGSYTGDW